jgi:type IV pilus assembly protein PilA
MKSNNKKFNLKNRGFTIVELLVVIVVIGILAAITIVSYAGITARANASQTKQLANNIITKAGIYQTEGTTGTWPITGAAAISATNSSGALTATVSTTGVALAAASLTTFSYQVCGTTTQTAAVYTAPANLAAITNPTGVIVGYWDYGLAVPAQATLTAGNTTAGSSGPYFSGGVSIPNLVACYYTTS